MSLCLKQSFIKDEKKTTFFFQLNGLTFWSVRKLQRKQKGFLPVKAKSPAKEQKYMGDGEYSEIGAYAVVKDKSKGYVHV